MTELLLNSFYPQESPDRSTSAALGPLQAQRCLSFLAQNETAALVFYSNFYKFTSVGSAIKMCVLLLEVLVEAVSGTGAVSCMSLSQGTDGANDDFDVKSAENRKVNSNSIRSEKAKKLLARAKRRRESEV